jgi:predicted transcriptional regulator
MMLDRSRRLVRLGWWCVVARLELRVPDDLLSRVRTAAGFESVSSWVRRALEEKLESLELTSDPSVRRGLADLEAGRLLSASEVFASEASEEAPSGGREVAGSMKSPAAQPDRPASPRVSRPFNPRPKAVRSERA